MKALVIGLGSMGKRRIRCLKALGVEAISGFDLRKDRCQEAGQLNAKLNIIPSVDVAAIKDHDVVIISVPPDHHDTYMQKCLEAKRSFFVEASVIDEALVKIGEQADNLGIVAAPSATLIYHPAIQLITEIIKSKKIGNVCNFIYHSGQYLPDWHPYENVKDYYVSNPLTGGAREIVPFELSWLVRCFGWPKSVQGQVLKTREIKGAEKIDDTYVLNLLFPTHPGLLVVDVVCRVASRRLVVIAEEGQLHWDWDEKAIKVYESKKEKWQEYKYDAGQAASGYNANIGELMYIDEVKNFLMAVQKKESFRNTMADDARILKVLSSVESFSKMTKGIEL